MEQQQQQPEENMRDKAVEALKTIYDPEIPVDVWELGLIYELTVYPVNNLFVRMTLTSPSCPSAEEIPVEVERKLREVENVNDVTVELTFDPPYTMEMMSEVAKLELGFM
ncbi:MAG: iron-sulfur cluster assembly protein [Thermoflexibacter sp.]|jgi:FeS assembly SUF system protein|nr:iron-sulfur cluster assembly protein [Thermoflexibacter sp.]